MTNYLKRVGFFKLIVVSWLVSIGALLSEESVSSEIGSVAVEGTDVKVQHSYSFGVVPQQSATKLARLWGPILQYLSEQTGDRLVFKTAPTIPQFEDRLRQGDYDFAYMNPYHYVVFHEFPGYRAFARQENKAIQGIVVVHKDSAIQTLEQLEGQQLAFPAPAAFAATLLPRGHFSKERITINPRYVSSHDSVYRAVEKGVFPAGGGIIRTLNNTDPKIKENLRILWTSSPYTPHAFAAHPRIDQGKVDKLRQAMQVMKETKDGVALLQSIKFSGIKQAKDEQWNDVRALDMQALKYHKEE